MHVKENVTEDGKKTERIAKEISQWENVQLACVITRNAEVNAYSLIRSMSYKSKRYSDAIQYSKIGAIFLISAITELRCHPFNMKKGYGMIEARTRTGVGIISSSPDCPLNTKDISPYKD